MIVISQPMYAEDWDHDPVHEEDDKWYFWDETWADRHGPYDSEKEARAEMKRYCVEVLGEADTDANG